MTVYEFIRGWDAEPLTVFAPSLEHAERIYAEWIAAHHPQRPPFSHMTYAYEGKLLEARPALAMAAKLEIAGVGYFDTTLGIWMIAQADQPAKGPLVPPSSDVNYYRVSSDDGDHAMVFARSYEEAITFFLAWNLDAYGEAPERIEIRQRSRWDLVLAMAPCRDDMEAGLTGVAAWTMDGLWRVYEPTEGTSLPASLK